MAVRVVAEPGVAELGVAEPVVEEASAVVLAVLEEAEPAAEDLPGVAAGLLAARGVVEVELEPELERERERVSDRAGLEGARELASQ